MQNLLSLENAPPLRAPLRFFLTAPLFLMLAGALLIWRGPEVFTSRWMPASLALTHLLTIGVLLQVMLGALIQILPVVAGASMARPVLLATVVHAGLTSGTLALAAGFLFPGSGWLTVAAVLLGSAILYFLLAAAWALRSTPCTSPTILGLRLALPGLLVVVLLGGIMALGLRAGWGLPYLSLADLHAAWGFAGWSGILLVAMAYVVVPMFQLTPGYPARAGWLLPSFLSAACLLWLGSELIGSPRLAAFAQAVLAICGLCFVGLTWRLQQQRRRARVDALHRHWHLALCALSVALCMLFAEALIPELRTLQGWTSVFAILLVIGGLLSFIFGMLCKIVPFLAWLHLQGLGKGLAPTVNRILSENEMQRHFLLHLLVLFLLLGAALWPTTLAQLAGAALLLSAAWFEFNLLLAAQRFRQHRAALIGGAG